MKASLVLFLLIAVSVNAVLNVQEKGRLALQQRKEVGDQLLKNEEGNNAFKDFLENLEYDLKSFTLLVETTELKQLLEFNKQENKPLANFVTSFCSIDLDYSIKYLVLKMEKEIQRDRKNIYRSIINDLIKVKLTVEFLGEKVQEMLYVLESSNGNEQLLKKAVDDFQRILLDNHFMTKFTWAKNLFNTL